MPSEIIELETGGTEWLARLGLADRSGANVKELSHGNQQRAQDVVIIDHGHVVAKGHIDAQRQASPRRRIELRLEGAPPGWLPSLAGVELVERRNGSKPPSFQLRSGVAPPTAQVVIAERGSGWAASRPSRT